MDIEVKQGELSGMKAGAMIMGLGLTGGPLTGEIAAVDKTLNGAVSRAFNNKRFTGKTGEVMITDTLGKLPGDYLVLFGLGKTGEMTPTKLREAVSEVCRALRRENITTAALSITNLYSPELSSERLGQVIAEGCLLGLYTFRKYLTPGADDKSEVEKLTIVSGSHDSAELEKGVKAGRIIAQAVALARDMANEPSNYMTPDQMAAVAGSLARDYQLELTLIEKDEMERLGMGATLGVARGSHMAPRFMLLRYQGRPSKDTDLVLIGKAVTFDSGGISIKPSDKMGDMKADMTGGAAVLAAISAIAQLKPGLNITAAVAAVENMPSGHAYKPGDVVRAMNGKTIEVISTDAEGRLTLADVLSYANAVIKPKNIVDVATLTGAIVVALGSVASAVFTNNQALADRVLRAGKEAGELSWQMPMFEEYKELNKSDIADLKNSGGRAGGAITAALFLGEFAGETPWVHMDIAGVDLSEKENKCLVKGATGIPVRTLIDLAMGMAQP